MSGHDNKRKFPRLNVRRAATVEADGSEFLLATVNLSFGGAFLETDKQVGVGRMIRIGFDVDGATVNTAARVVHRTAAGLAIVFVEPPETFVNALCRIIGNRIQADARQGAGRDEVPGRIALLVYENGEHDIVFTSSLGPQGAWVIGQRSWPSGSELRVTLPERGLFDSRADVIWHDERAMRIEFVEPSAEFCSAYRRVLTALSA